MSVTGYIARSRSRPDSRPSRTMTGASAMPMSTDVVNMRCSSLIGEYVEHCGDPVDSDRVAYVAQSDQIELPERLGIVHDRYQLPPDPVAQLLDRDPLGRDE